MSKRHDPFSADEFTAYASGHKTAADKAKFANHFVRFVNSDFNPNLFYDWFYRELTFSFGHIAHYNRAGFYATWFSDDARKLDFLTRITKYRSVGDPGYCMTDVEKALATWVSYSSNDVVLKYAKRVADAYETHERAEWARLRAKYGDGSMPHVGIPVVEGHRQTV